MNGVMEESMMVNTRWIKNMVLENIGGKMVEFMRDFGKMDDSMVIYLYNYFNIDI